MGRYKDIQDKVLLNRFREAQRTDVKAWINAEYAYLWNENDLSFQHVTAMDPTLGQLTVTAGDNTPTLPTELADVEGLYDDQGSALVPLEPEMFERTYRGLTSRSQPVHFMVVNRTLYLGPTPADNATFTIGYKRILSHLDNGGAIVNGAMSADTDQPMWTVDHDEVLVAGARVRGKKRAQDPTWQADLEERDELLAALLVAFSPSNLAKPVYPRDPL